MNETTRIIQLLRKYDLPIGANNAYYLHDGLIHGFFQPRLCPIPLITSGSSTTVSTDQTKKFPGEIGVGSVIYIKNGNPQGIVPVVAGDSIRTVWEARTVTAVTDAYNLVVDEAINILEASDGFAYRVLATGDAIDEGWIGTSAARERILSAEVLTGGPVDLEVWGKNDDQEPFLIESFSLATSATHVYEGHAEYTRVMFAAAVAARVSASLVTRRFNS